MLNSKCQRLRGKGEEWKGWQNITATAWFVLVFVVRGCLSQFQSTVNFLDLRAEAVCRKGC